MKKIILLIIVISMLIIGCVYEKSSENIKDNLNVYHNETDLYDLQLTIISPEQNNLAKGTYTFRELNIGNGKIDGEDIEVSGILRRVENGESKQGLLGYGLTSANATIEQRGQSARLFDQKSYEINLLKSGGLFLNHEILNLNKHIADDTRIINKLAFDLMKEIPGLLSLDTNFVNLYIKDLSGDTKEFVDYGLFTQVEEIDEEYFKKRNLPPTGELYKIINFEFRNYPEEIVSRDSEFYDKDVFETRVEIEWDSNHNNFVTLVKDINNSLKPFDKTFEKYFNSENYLSWLATNILLGNIDTASGNYYLYSPNNSAIWYFIPWDYDKSLTGYIDDGAIWKRGVSNYWGNPLHKKFLKNDENRKKLSQMIEKLYSSVFNKNKVNELTRSYLPILEKSFNKSPDALESGAYKEVMKKINSFPKEIANNKKIYYESLQKPMPFNIGSIVDLGEFLSINWDKAYDFQGDQIHYNVTISSDPFEKNIIIKKEDINETELIVERLKPGKYYLKITAEDTDGNIQQAFDYYIDRKNNLFYPGIKSFYLE